MNSRKNLLLITEDFPVGIAEATFLPTEYEALCKEFNVTIVMVSGKPLGGDVLAFENGRASLFEIATKEYRSELKSALKVATSLKQKLAIVRNVTRSQEHAVVAYKQLDRIIAERNIDIIYSYWCFDQVLAAVRLKDKYPKLKVVSRFHGFDLYTWRTGAAQWQCFRNEILPKLDKLIFVSQQGRRYMLDTWPNIDESKCLVSHIGTGENQRIAYKDGEYYTIISCSDMISLKRIDLIIEALAQLPSDIKVQWYHLGDGFLESELKQFAKEKLEDKPNIKYMFAGRLPFGEVCEFYRNVTPTAFITTSSTEGLPISIVEAFSMGIPALATDVGGMRELVDDSTGKLMSSNPDAKEVARTILDFISMHETDRQRIADNAYNRWQEEHNSSQQSQRLVDMLKALCK